MVFRKNKDVKSNFFSSWQPESRYSFSQVRLAPAPVTGRQEYVEGQEVEVFTRATDSEIYGWWKAVIKMIRGEFIVVEFVSVDGGHFTEIVSQDRVRQRNPNGPIDKSMFFKFEIEVPEELREQ